jgi:ribosomal-protein-alanine N-acetyltransferase
MEFDVLTTERLILRKLTPQDFNYIFEHYSKEEIINQLGLTTNEEFLKEQEKVKGGYTTYDRTIIQFKLVLKETNEVIGSCGFHNWYSIHSRAELGYALTKEEFKQKGYMSEAVKTIINYGFNTMNLNRIEAFVGPTNIASLSIVNKLGFIQEGHLKQHYFKDGIIEDSIIFSLLKTDYNAKIKSSTN